MFENLFKRCPHEYKQVGFIPAVVTHEGKDYKVPCYFLECKYCGKRRVLRESDYNYSDSFLETIELWIKGQYKINFKDYQKDEPKYDSGERDWRKYYEMILTTIRSELEKFNIPMHDSENRLVLNNVKGMVNNALTEEVLNEETK